MLDYTIADASSGFSDGKLSPVELTEQCLSSIDRYDSKIFAFSCVTAERARREAREAERAWSSGQSRGPLHGIPIGVKDVFKTAGIPTTGQSRTREGYVPTIDAEAVRRLSRAGAILLGKLTTHEFAMGGPSFDLPKPPARNPWRLTAYTGGSSSGAAAAVAAGFVLGALGTDTAGSVRLPASLCGLVGLKPSTGLVSRAGTFPLSYSFDHVGPIVRNSRDCAMLLQAIAGFDPEDEASRQTSYRDFCGQMNSDSVHNLRIGFVDIDHVAISPAVSSGLSAAAKQFADLGAVLAPTRLPSLFDFHAAIVTIMLAEAFAVYGEELEEHWTSFGSSFRHRVMPGKLVSGAEYVKAQRLRLSLKRVVDRELSKFDMLLLPTTSAVAPPLDQVSEIAFFERPSFTAIANLTGHPALNIFGGVDNGLPFGFQLVGRMDDDARLLAIGNAYEQATPWSKMRPEMAE